MPRTFRLATAVIASAAGIAAMAAPASQAYVIAGGSYEAYALDESMPILSFPSLLDGPACTPATIGCDRFTLDVREIQGTLSVTTAWFADIRPVLRPVLPDANHVTVETPVPNVCVGISTVGPTPPDGQIDDPTPMHLAVYLNGGSAGEPVAVSYDGTLLFTAAPGTRYLVTAAQSPDTVPGQTRYDVRFAAKDINHGLPYWRSTVNDTLLCGPGTWAVDAPLGLG